MKETDNYNEAQFLKNRNDLRNFLVFSMILFVLYSGMLFVEALFFYGNIKSAVFSILAPIPLIIIAFSFYLFRPKSMNWPILIAVLTQITFLVVGSYLKELEYYFIISLLSLASLMVLKNFHTLITATAMMTFINIVIIAFFLPHLDWVNHYRFIFHFLFFFLGSIFLALVTHNVEQKGTQVNKAHATFASLLKSSPNLMIITDANNCVLYISDQMAKFIQYPNKEYATGQPLIDIVADFRLKLMFADILDTEGYFESIIELDIDDEHQHLKIVKDELSEEQEGAFIDITDITPTIKSQQAAIEANKSKSAFLATMSHEIRTPMNAIIGLSQIQLQRDHLSQECKMAFNRILGSGNILLNIINDILDLSKIETGKMELILQEYHLPELINDTAQLNIVRIGSKPIEFILDIDENLPLKMIGDELRIKQILNNLISNAIKYTAEGFVKLTVYHVTSDNDAKLCFKVADTGQGLKPEDREKLFSEYARFNAEANRNIEGTGIGLMIMKNLVKLMDGTIEVESEYGKGSVFSVELKQKVVECLPMGTELVKQLTTFTFSNEKQSADTKVQREQMQYGKVLIVDDVETNLFVAEGLLSFYGLQIETVLSGFRAIEKIENGSIYDVIFMDHMMPVMDGIETTQKLRDMEYHGTIVALTANALVGNRELFITKGFDDFLPKPIVVSQLDEILMKYIYKSGNAFPRQAGDDKRVVEFDNVKNFVQQAGNTEKLNPKLLKVFLRDAENAIETLRETLQNEDIKLFTTCAHAMKAVLAYADEQELSELALSLEKAGQIGDFDFISANAHYFIDSLENMVKKLSQHEKDPDTQANDENIQEDKEYLTKQLLSMKAAAEDYDDAKVYMIIDALKEKAWKKQTETELDNIKEILFLHSNFEKVVENITTLLDLI